MTRPEAARNGATRRVPAGMKRRGLLILLGLGLLIPSLEAQDAPLAFRFAMGGRPLAGPVVSGGLVWTISESRSLFVLDESGRAIGRRAWTRGEPVFIAPDPFGRALIGLVDGSLLLLNRAGLEVWSTGPGESSRLSPAFGSDGRSYALVGSRLRCRSANGRVLWTLELDGEASLAPLAFARPSGDPDGLPAEGVLVAVSGGRLLWVSEDGRAGPPLDSGSQISTLAAAPDRSALAGAVLVAHGDGSARILAPDGTAGKPFRLPFAPFLLRGFEGGWLACDVSGALAVLTADGAPRWNAKASVGMPSGLEYFGAGAGARVVVVGLRGAASFDPEGMPMRALTIYGASGRAAASPLGRVYAGGEDWILYAYDFERPQDAAATMPPGLPLAAIRAAAAEELFWNPGLRDVDALRAELARLAKSLRSGTIGTDEGEAAAYASAIALGLGEAPRAIAGGAAPQGPQPIDPLARSAACEFLGALGSPRYASVLAAVYSGDPDPAVRAAAARAAGELGLDPDSKALAAFAAAIDRSILDEGLAFATIGAIEALYRANGTLRDPSAALALVRLAEKPYGAAVRSRAERALKTLARRP